MCEFGRVWEIRRSIMNVGKSRVMRYSRHVNVCRMHVRLNGETIGSGLFLISGIASGGG